MRRLNVNYVIGGSVTINMNDLVDIWHLRERIQSAYGQSLNAPLVSIGLYVDGVRLNKLDDVFALGDEYFQTGGPEVMVQITPPSSRMISGFIDYPFAQGSGVEFEGLPGSAKPKINRFALAQKIDLIVDQKNSLLITSPSYTGKTALANVMFDYWKDRGKTVHFVSFKGYTSSQDLDEFIFTRCGQTIQTLLLSNAHIILDESQEVYGVNSFWDNFKSGAYRCKLLAFGVFGLKRFGNLRSPPQFNEKWYYDDIKFSRAECDELVQKFLEFNAGDQVVQSVLQPENIGNLFEFLNYHPGLVYRALNILCYEFFHGSYNAKSAEDVRKLIANGKLIYLLKKKSRCFDLNGYDNYRQMIGQGADDLMLKLITYNSIPLSGESEFAIHRSGIGIADPEENLVQFASEMMRLYWREEYYCAVYGVSASLALERDQLLRETASSLLMRILRLFNPVVFQNSLSRGSDDDLYERIFQNEFYRCCFLLAPSQCHPDVGALYGSRGFLDFYVNGEVAIGFELLRNGNLLKNHMARFQSNGIYRNIPLRDYAIVDFYMQHTDEPALGEKYFKISFQDNFKIINVQHQGQVQQIRCNNEA